jgi:flagellar brake protein
MNATALPENISLESERYLIHSRFEIIALLRAVIDCHALVTIYYKHGQESLVTNLLSVNPDFEEVILDFGSAADGNRRLLGSPAFTVVTFVDHVKIQFSAQRAEQTVYEDKPALRVRLPQTLLRLQRREHYRLSPPITRPLKCAVADLIDKHGKGVEYKIVDISCGGIGLLAEAHQPRLALGKAISDCAIELHDVGKISTDLIVRNTHGIPHSMQGQRYGCQFAGIPGTMVNMVQRYITKIQQERRART